MSQMKKSKIIVLSILLAALAAICGTTETAAQTTAKKIKQVNVCLSKNESVFGQKFDFETASPHETLANIGESVVALDEMLKCTDEGLRIKNLNVRVRCDWRERQGEYRNLRPFFALQACFFENLLETDRLGNESLETVKTGNKPAAQAKVSLMNEFAVKTRRCAEDGMKLKNLDADLGAGFAEEFAQAQKLVAAVEDLQRVIARMPE
jgi:predicted transcriptional regulator